MGQRGQICPHPLFSVMSFKEGELLWPNTVWLLIFRSPLSNEKLFKWILIYGFIFKSFESWNVGNFTKQIWEMLDTLGFLNVLNAHIFLFLKTYGCFFWKTYLYIYVLNINLLNLPKYWQQNYIQRVGKSVPPSRVLAPKGSLSIGLHYVEKSLLYWTESPEIIFFSAKSLAVILE